MKRLSSDALCRGAVLALPRGQARLRGHLRPDGTLVQLMQPCSNW